MNGADLLCETLLANGIDTCFANPGTSEMHFVAALDRQPRMRCVLGLFEGVVTGAADGYARMADKPAATLLHLGPGLANGLANLHNARRAHSPMVNIVGDHATYHLQHDAPLTSDIDSLAWPMSSWVGRADAADSVGTRTAQAIQAARTGAGGIATLILHADAAWGHTSAPVPAIALPPARAKPDPALIAQAGNALRNGKSTTILVGGDALRAAQLDLLDRIAQQTGARVMAQQANGRMQRGAGRVALDRVPYVIDDALATFRDTQQVILIGAIAPVGFFAYPGKPGSMLPEACQVIALADVNADLAAAVTALADETGLAPAPRLAHRARPPMPAGTLTPDAIAIALAHLMPAQAIICDESVTSGRDFFGTTYGAEPHDFLQLTGGAIGEGIPLAVGAALACPDRKVIGLQADGSGMYTVQGLWTQARERLDVVTIIFANRLYKILHGELLNVGAAAAGENARRMLDLDDPALDWVAISRGMGVEAARTDSCEGFLDLLRAALSRKGPFLIEAIV